MGAAEGDGRVFVRIDVEYSLCGPEGRVSPGTQAKAWFFDVPAGRDNEEAWGELLHRLFYDANVRLGRAEPNDVNYLNLESFRRTEVDVEALLAAGAGTAWEAMPWFAAHREVAWEGAACYYVDERGEYDVMGASDYTELVMNRLLRAGRVDEAGFVGFFDRVSALAGVSPPRGRKYFDEREARFAAIAAVRPARGYKRPVGEGAGRSGPVEKGLIGG